MAVEAVPILSERSLSDPPRQLGELMAHASSQLAAIVDSVPLLLHGNIAPWAERELSLSDAVICAAVSRANLALVGRTGNAKTMWAKTALAALTERPEQLFCMHDVDDGIFEALVPHGSSVLVQESPLVTADGVRLEELNRALPQSQPALKRITSAEFPSHKLILATMNPDEDYATQRIDRSIASSFLYIDFENAKSIDDAAALPTQRPIRSSEIIPACLRHGGRPMIDALQSLGYVVDGMSLTREAREFLGCVNCNVCPILGRKPGKPKPDCIDCSANKASCCGALGAVPDSVVIRLGQLARSLAAMDFARGLIEAPEAATEHLLVFLPMALDWQCADLPLGDTRLPRLAKDFAEGLLGAIRGFHEQFEDALDLLEADPDAELIEPVRKAFEGYGSAVSPPVAAILPHYARIRGRERGRR